MKMVLTACVFFSAGVFLSSQYLSHVFETEVL